MVDERKKKNHGFLTILFFLASSRFFLTVLESSSFFSLMFVSALYMLCCVICICGIKGYSKQLFQSNVLFLILFIILLLVYGLLIHDADSLSMNDNFWKQNIILLGFWAQYCFLCSCDNFTKKRFLFFILFLTAVSSVIVIWVSLSFGSLSIRNTAQGFYVIPIRYGGFDFTYELLMLNCILSSFLTKNYNNLTSELRVVLVVFICLFSFTILLSGYTTAQVVLFVILALNLLRGKYKYIFALLFIAFSLYVTLFSSSFINMITSFGFLSDLTIERIAEFINGIKLGDSFSVYSARSYRMQMSWDIFIKNPFFGGVAQNYSAFQFGRHSEWIDQLARYGIFVYGFELLFICSTNKKMKKKLSNISKTVNGAFWFLIIIGIFENVNLSTLLAPYFIVLPIIDALLTDANDRY